MTTLLLEKGYEGHGLISRTSIERFDPIEKYVKHTSVHLHYGDMTESANLIRIISEIQPDAVYN